MRAVMVSVLLTVAAVIAFSVPSLATASAVAVNTSPDRVQEFTSSQNDPAGWPQCADGTKVDLDGQGRFTYTLASPATLLVIKAATWNFIWDNPTAGVYGVPVAPDGTVHAISHVIICGATTPSSTSATGTATETTATGTATESSESASATMPTESASATMPSESASATKSSESATATMPTESASATTSTESGTATETSELGASSASTSSAAGAPTGPTTVAAASSGTLPRTGGDVMRIIGVALAALAVGTVLWFVGRRRGPRPSHR